MLFFKCNFLIWNNYNKKIIYGYACRMEQKEKREINIIHNEKKEKEKIKSKTKE